MALWFKGPTAPKPLDKTNERRQRRCKMSRLRQESERHLKNGALPLLLGKGVRFSSFLAPFKFESWSDEELDQLLMPKNPRIHC